MEFFVAEQLGMTVRALRADMDNAEFVRWAIYFARKAQRQQIASAR